jgi:hypothetical protein
MGELIVAFSRGAKAALCGAGWRKHSGDIFTRELGDGTRAWLGLNRATKRPPLQIHPVGGVRHEATMRLCDELGGGKRYVVPTLSEPLAYLGTARAEDLSIETSSAVKPAVDQLLNLVESRLMPFAEAHRDPERQLDALRLRQHLAFREYAIIRRPAMLVVLGRVEEAIDALDEELATLSGRDDEAADNYRTLGDALRDWISTHA